MALDIGYNHCERLRVLFNNVALQAWRKYSLGYNDYIHEGRTKRISWYFPSYVLNNIAAPSEVVNGVVYGAFPFYNQTYITLAKRKGGFYLENAPLTTFMVAAQGLPITPRGSNVGHYQFELDNWEVDPQQSYLKFTAPFAANNYVFDLFFDLQPQ